MVATGDNEDTDLHDEEEDSQSSYITPLANGTLSGSGASAQKSRLSARRNKEVAIDCILGDPKLDESGSPTLYRVAIQTDYFSLLPSQPSPFLSVRAIVFG